MENNEKKQELKPEVKTFLTLSFITFATIKIMREYARIKHADTTHIYYILDGTILPFM